MVDWHAWATGGIVFDILSGVLFIAFGLFVGLKRPRTRAGLAAAAFAIGVGILSVGSNINNFGTIGQLDPRQDTPLAIISSLSGIVGLGVAAVGAVALVRLQTRNSPTRPLATVMLVLTGASCLAGAWNAYAIPSAGTEAVAVLALSMTAVTLYAGVTPFLLWMAVSLEGEGRASELIALAVVPFAAAWTLTRVMQWYGTAFFPGMRPAFIATLLAIAIFALQRRPSSQRLFAWTALWTLAAFLWGWAFRDHDPTNLGFNGMTRVLAVFVLGYAVVRHRAFDLDVKLRFTLRQSTIAAVFVAVFVGVQSFVSEFITAEAGLIAGAVATAILVFALSPLQKFGEQVADRALPNARPINNRTPLERTQLYVDLAEAAWADGVVTAKEANVLETARIKLGLSLEEAHAIDARSRSALTSTASARGSGQPAH